MLADTTGTRLRAARRALRLSRRDVAEKLDIPIGQLAAVERGEQQPAPTLVTMLARLYRRSEEWVRGHTEPVPATVLDQIAAADIPEADKRRITEFAHTLAGH